jgi:Acetylornithine deacetylase/Succinyl-diaminopimelate desuccinylase and related deacylases
MAKTKVNDTMQASELLSYLEAQKGAMIEATRALVEYESPSTDKALLDALANFMADRFAHMGAAVDLIDNPKGGNNLRISFAGPSEQKPGLILCHYDTVWAAGTLARMPFKIEGEKVYGPGVFDMKASIVLVEYAIRALAELQQKLPRPITLLLTSDEETGSLNSRALIEEQAKASAYVLVLEPPITGGALKTGRKGIGRFTLEIEGRASHAGTEPEKGLSAIEEMAHQILALHALRDKEKGSTVNVGVVSGGTRPNVVAARAHLDIDVRAWTLSEAERLTNAIKQLKPVTPGIVLHPAGGFNRPPMERSESIVKLYERARNLGRQIGLELGEGQTGGGSDANFTAALGVPTLDGLGMPGAGAHADHEHIDSEHFPSRAALLALLLLDL